MSMQLGIILGIVAIGALGVIGRKRQKDLSSWTVGERDMPKWTAWFLQAGESLTTFSFLGLAGIAFGGGVSAVFAVGYLTISSIGLFFVAPRIRRLGANRGYLTIADFFEDRFSSKALGRVVALVGALFLIPYLQLQVTGLGLIVELVTGSSAARGLSMVVASILVVLFILWAGIKGLARVAVFKDIAMLVALIIVVCGVVFSIGGIPEVFARISDTQPLLLTLGSPDYDTTFFITAMLVTGIGSSLNTFPHLWPPVLAAKSGAVLRSNYKWLAIYQFVLFVPITVGMAAVLVLDPDTTGNRVLLSMTAETLPEWLVAIVAISGAAAAMVPAGAIAMGISTLVSNNLIPSRTSRNKMRVNHAVVVAAVGLALAFGLVRSDIGSLLLLTYGGLTQLAPAVSLALPDRVRAGAVPVMLGILAGTGTVALITFAELPIGSWDSGLIALAPNLVVTGVAEFIRRRVNRQGAGPGSESRRPLAADSAPLPVEQEA